MVDFTVCSVFHAPLPCAWNWIATASVPVPYFAGRASPQTVTAGTPGFAPDVTLPPDFVTQAENAWANVKRALEQAGFGLTDLVKVNTSVTSADDIAAYKDIRRNALGDLKPAFMLQVVPGMIRPEILIEVEVWAAKPADGD